MVYCSPSRAVTKDVRISLKSVVNFTTQFAFLQRMPATVLGCAVVLVVGLLEVGCVCASFLLCVSLIALVVARAPPLITLLVVRTEFPVTAGAALRFCLPCGVAHLLTYLLTVCIREWTPKDIVSIW